jgi:hypothetical protein
MTIHVREKPPLRLHERVVTPSGRVYRWGDDEPDPVNAPSGRRFSSTMPGGFESLDLTLPRKPGVDYSDLQRLSTIQVLGVGGEIAWEGRLERAPKVAGDQIAISPSAAGWQNHLEDDKSAQMVYRDIDLTQWIAPSAQRRIDAAAANIYDKGDFEVVPDPTTGRPALRTAVSDAWAASAPPLCEAYYDAGPGGIGDLYWSLIKGAAINAATAQWQWEALLSPDDRLSAPDTTGDLQISGATSGTLSATDHAKRFAAVRLFWSAPSAAGTAGQVFPINWTDLVVYGDHGLPVRGTEPDAGFYDGDIWAHAIRTWAPLLNFTEGPDGTIQSSGFVIPQAAHRDPTTAGEIGRQASRFGLRDWAVWENKTFYLDDRGARGRRWRARIGPAKLEETGPQIDRLWESVIVSYQDVDGTTKTVGPPGSGADVETSALKDSDPTNPANELGIIRRDLLAMGRTSTPAGATEVGQRFLEAQKLLDTSGRATLVGHVLDDRGVLHPYWKVRAGDEISFVDSNDNSYRRIVKAEPDDTAKACSIDLDSPPEGLDALLERLGVVLVPLGIN